ncbi:MAG: MauE/DoxX family redox-associated membrane protein [Nitrospinota bacterium]
MKARAAQLVLRAGLALVFLWFGIDKFFRPLAWVGFIPSSLYKSLGGWVSWFMYALGAAETAIGLALATGLWLRAGAWAASALLAGIILGVGFSSTFTRPEIVRDSGLLGAALSLALRGRNPS